MRVAASLVVMVLVMSLPALAASDRRVRLPSAADTIRSRISAEQLLRGGRGPELTLPGEISDDERVDVAITPQGVPSAVSVEQRLRVAEAGDFFVKIPGPVDDVEALPDSSSQPGLRSGSLVWQGFATEGDILGARVALVPEREAERLPVKVRVEAIVDGLSTDLTEDIDGDLVLEVSVTNTTETTVSLPRAEADPKAVAAALDTLHATLLRETRPAPGSDGLPRSIPVTSPVSRRDVAISAPLRVIVRVGFGPGSQKTSEAVLSGAHLSETFRLRAPASTAPKITVEVMPVAPAASEVRPPARDWATAQTTGRVSGSAMLDRLVAVLAEAARLPDVDGYLGNPDRDGPSETRYLYSLVIAEPPVARTPHPPEPRSVSVLGVIVASLLTLMALAGGAVWWATS
ncbi:MAG: hypothetical protein QOG04_2006 [Actinomycetota bacterium]|jgi:hypothetical protein|nr:hypothetical protein [Actinomycetota bacterium]